MKGKDYQNLKKKVIRNGNTESSKIEERLKSTNYVIT